ncbi:BTB/POZ domain-containing protein 6-A [Pseudolycoriella hygida]|uniref:BTB/POZ domain-containing protein 6-A n=1 Tax=Pseudolycoriella hygida TaxID=35572 RepID=A0A9Q0MU15_9DIPT|nr:BTB/POZ domain-containing protein 6-A [Pseudolycoriella hygida]
MDTSESSTKRQRIETPETEVDLVTSKSAFAAKIFRAQYLDEKTADIYFICGSQRQRVPAHKCILSKASDAFDKMFYGPMAEVGDIQLPDRSPEAFRNFLKFCYFDEVNLNLEHIVEIMDLTNKYCMPECLVVCGNFWAKHLTYDDICFAYHWAIFFGEAEFKKFCEQKICAHPQLVFQSSSFLNCEYTVLEHILELDSMWCEESIVLGACLNWARHACVQTGSNPKCNENLRSVLKDSLYKIRYGSMTLKEFREHMDTTDGLFSDAKEYEDIIRLLSGSTELKTGRFKANSRFQTSFFTWDEDRALKCEINCNNSSVFTCNKSMLLGGFYCTKNCQIAQFDMTIIEKSNSWGMGEGKVIHSQRVTLLNNDETFIEIKKANGEKGQMHHIFIRPDCKYQIKFEPHNSQPHRSFRKRFSFGRREIRLDDETVLMLKFPQETNIEDRCIINCLKFNRL